MSRLPPAVTPVPGERTVSPIGSPSTAAAATASVSPIASSLSAASTSLATSRGSAAIFSSTVGSTLASASLIASVPCEKTSFRIATTPPTA